MGSALSLLAQWKQEKTLFPLLWRQTSKENSGRSGIQTLNAQEGGLPAVASAEISHIRILLLFDMQLPHTSFRNSLFRSRMLMKWSELHRS
jgi:hypothetical protein